MNTNPKYYLSGLEIYNLKKDTLEILSKRIFDGNFFSILLVRSGALSIQIDDTVKQLSSNELILISSKSSCKVLNFDDTLQIYLVSFTHKFVFKNSIKKPNIGYFELFITKSLHKISLKSKETSILIKTFKILEDNKKYSNRHIFQNEVLLFTFNLLLYEVAGIYQTYSHHIKVKHSRKEKLVFHFFTILEIHYKEQHNVKFYASSLFITAGHLNKSIKDVTGKTAKQWIEEEIIIEAKKMLQNDDLTISSISEELRFSSPSFFSNFFKKHISISPSEYRSRLIL